MMTLMRHLAVVHEFACHEEDFSIIPLLMTPYMDLDNVSLIPHMIEEIPNFKIFLKPYMSKRVDCLVIHTKAQQFCFYMRDDGYPAMHFKILSISPIWGPEDSILVWRQYKDAKYMLSDEDRKHCKPDPMKNGPKSSKVYPDT